MRALRERQRSDRVVCSPSQTRNAVLDVIRRARQRLTLSLFRCTDDAIIVEIARAVDRGVDVNIIVTPRSKGKKKLRRLWEALETTGAAIHPYTDPVVKYHAKYMVADDGPAVVASLNFTRKCFQNTVDALVITYDPAVVDGLHRLQAADRDGLPLPPDLPERLIVGPERARRQLTAIIESARSSIRLIDAKVSDPVMSRLLDACRQKGVAVEVHSAKRLNGRQSHGKLMLVDGHTLVVGGLALAALSLDFRREVALVVHDGPAVAAVVRLFDAVAPAAAKPGAALAAGG